MAIKLFIICLQFCNFLFRIIQDINIGEELIALGHATYIDVTKNSECMDEGISVNEEIEITDTNSIISKEMKDLVDDITDNSIVSSSNNVQNCKDPEDIKTKDDFQNESSPIKESSISPIEALQETPIRIMSSNSTSCQ